MTNYWIMKCEPSAYSIDDLKNDGFTTWEGVRNYQVRNLMRDEMKDGDLALFYHSNASPSGAAGVCRICKEAHPDPSAWNQHSRYYDPKASPENPRWVMVEVEFVEKFPSIVSIRQMRSVPELSAMPLLRKGSRLSIVSLTKDEFEIICSLGRTKEQVHQLSTSLQETI